MPLLAFVSSSFTGAALRPRSVARSSLRRRLPLPAARPAAQSPRLPHHITPCLSSVPSRSDLPPSSPPTRTAVPSTRVFIATRTAIFVAMSLTYATYVFLRSTFTYVAPVMASTLSLSLPEIGKITSAFPLAYGASRLFMGLLVDRTAPHKALCLGLLFAGVLNATMGLTAVVPALALLWALNGLVQGVGAGASAKMLTAWFSPQERGLYWALWSTSANIGAFLAPVVCARLAATAGFSAGFLVPGAIAVTWAAIMLPLLKSSPTDAKLTPPWEAAVRVTPQSLVESAPEKPEKLDQATWRSVLVEGVIKNRTIWALACAYFFVYLVRSGTKSWLHFWLVQARQCGAADAAYRVSGMEVGGIAGTFSAGVVSDATGGRRVLVTIAYLSGLIVALAAAWLMPPGKPIWDFVAFSAVGFMINGPQMMIGLIGAEACDKRIVATATGVLGWISYLGAAASGFPLSVIIRRGGWTAYFVSLLASSACAVLCLVPMWRMKAEPEKKL